jgi:hypothetical protein
LKVAKLLFLFFHLFTLTPYNLSTSRMLLNEITRAVVSAILISSIASATQVNHLACTYPYKKFEYAGCYEDDRSNRSLGYSPGLEFSNTTVELCTAACKVS